MHRPVHNSTFVCSVAKMVVLCSLGTKDPDGKSAVSGCHGSTHFKGKKELRTVAYVERHDVKRLEELARAHASLAPVLEV